MAHAAAAGGAWSRQSSSRLGHHASTILIVAIVAVIAVGLKPLPGMLLVVVPVGLFALVVLAFLLMRDHDRRLCEHCAADIPLNPAETAKRYPNRFWMAHTIAEPRFLIPYLALLIGTNFAQGTFGHICWAVMQSTMIYLVLAHRTHRQLQPWCPWCSEDGGGEEAEAPPPVVPHDDRQLV